jgi:hypothetical protein
MSVVWWNPKNKTMNADTIATQGHFKYKESKLHSVGKWNFGVVGSSAVETFLKSKLADINDITELLKDTVPKDQDSEIVIYDTQNSKLWAVGVANDGAICVYTVDTARCKAIGYGSPAVVVLNDIGMSDYDIGQMLLKHFCNIAGPFEQIGQDGIRIELTEPQ